MRHLLDWSDWCEHSAQSWRYVHGLYSTPWCDECCNYTDGWRRAIRQPLWWAALVWCVGIGATLVLR